LERFSHPMWWGGLGALAALPSPHLGGGGEGGAVRGSSLRLAFKRLDRQTDSDNRCVRVSVAMLAQGVSLASVFLFLHEVPC